MAIYSRSSVQNLDNRWFWIRKNKRIASFDKGARWYWQNLFVCKRFKRTKYKFFGDWTCGSLLVTFCSLLMTFCSLLVTFCWLLFTFCWLLLTFCSLFFAGCSLLFARCLLLFAPCLLWNKVTVNRKKIDLAITKLRHRRFACKFQRWWFSKFSQHAKPFSKLAWSHKYWISLWCLYYNIWTRFYLHLCTWRVRSSRLEELYKKSVLKYFTKFTGKHLRWSLFHNKAAGWMSLTSLNTETGTGASLCIFWNF